MNTGLLLGGALGASICLLLYSLLPPRPALGSAIARWERVHSPATLRLAAPASVVPVIASGAQRAGSGWAHLHGRNASRRTSPCTASA